MCCRYTMGQARSAIHLLQLGQPAGRSGEGSALVEGRGFDSSPEARAGSNRELRPGSSTFPPANRQGLSTNAPFRGTGNLKGDGGIVKVITRLSRVAEPVDPRVRREDEP